MKSRLLIPVSLLLLSAACNNAPQPPADEAADSSVFTGYYEDSTAAGHLIRLNVSTTAEVKMTTDSGQYVPELIQIGDLAETDSHQVQLRLVTVNNGDPVKDTLLFRNDNGNLVGIYDTSIMLVRKERPLPTVKQLVFWVKDQYECDRGPGMGKMACYQVQYGNNIRAVAQPWATLSDSITGFTFEKGYLYKLKVDRIPREQPSRYRGLYEYRLAETMEKQAVK